MVLEEFSSFPFCSAVQIKHGPITLDQSPTSSCVDSVPCVPVKIEYLNNKLNRQHQFYHSIFLFVRAHLNKIYGGDGTSGAGGVIAPPIFLEICSIS